jgi:hypothetical protein
VNERYEPTCFSKKNKKTASLRLCEKRKKANRIIEYELFNQKKFQNEPKQNAAMREQNDVTGKKVL